MEEKRTSCNIRSFRGTSGWKNLIVNKFADEQYQHKIYINLLDFTGELFLERYKELRNEILHGLQCANPVYELIKRAYPNFVDSSDTVVIIDEIQESADIYNRIREFTRELKSDFIITGNYLGRILNKEFKYSAGNLDSLEIHTLDFEEFLKACGEETLYKIRPLWRQYRRGISKTIGIIPSLYTDWWLCGDGFEILKFSFYRTGKWRIIKNH